VVRQLDRHLRGGGQRAIDRVGIGGHVVLLDTPEETQSSTGSEKTFRHAKRWSSRRTKREPSEVMLGYARFRGARAESRRLGCGISRRELGCAWRRGRGRQLGQ